MAGAGAGASAGTDTGISSEKAACLDDSVVFTYPVNYGSQLKIDEGRTHTEHINDFHAVVVSGEGEAGWGEGFASKVSRDADRLAEERQRKEMESLDDYNPKLFVRPRSPSPDRDRKSDRPKSATSFRSAAVGGDPLDTLSPLYEWMLGTQVPLFGISLAHHLQATLRNQPVIRNKAQAEKGNVEIVVVKDDPIFRGLGTQLALTSFDKTTWTAGGRVVAPKESSSLGCTLLVRQDHENAINLPPNFELLASSRKCPCQLMRDRTKKIFYTAQFMPEVHNSRLLYNFLYLVEHPPAISARDKEIQEEEERAIAAARVREEEEAKAAAAAAEANAKAKRSAWKASQSPSPSLPQPGSSEGGGNAEDEPPGKEGAEPGLFLTDAAPLKK
jgi:GMP synthase-like glutamine amidotransferase